MSITASAEAGIVGDVNCDGLVNVTDLLAIVAVWGSCNEVCAEDIVPDQNVGVTDLLLVIANW